MPLALPTLPRRASLLDRLTELAQKQRGTRLMLGMAFTFATVLFLVGSWCVLDAVFGLPAAVRAIALVLTLLIAGTMVVRRIVAPAKRVTAQQFAHQLETKYPKLNDSVASAIAFLSKKDDNSSLRFQQVAVSRAQRLLAKYPLEDLIPTGKMWTWLLVLFVLAATLGITAMQNPPVARTSAVRFFDPFGAHNWATKTQVKLTSPGEPSLRMALGDPLDVSFEVTGLLPDTANIEVQLEGGASFEEPVGITESDKRKNFAEATARLDPHRIPKSFKFRVRANDDVTGWTSITLAPPPKLVPVDGRQSPQLHLSYPAYTDLPAIHLPDGSSTLEAVHGTRVRFSAAADRRIINAVLIPQVDRAGMNEAITVAGLAGFNPIASLGSAALAQDAIADIPVIISGGDGTRLNAEFTPHLAGLYKFVFTDETGLNGVRLLDFRMTADPEPIVTLERPLTGKDPSALLPNAAVFVEARAEDRTFAVKTLYIEYRVGGPDAPARTIRLVNGPTVGPNAATVLGGLGSIGEVKQSAVGALGQFPISLFTKPDGTAPVDGDRITIRAAATDFDTVSVLKEPGRSKEEFTIEVVSRSTLDMTFQRELAKLRSPLLKLREQQRSVRERTEEIQKQAEKNPLTPEQSGQLGQLEREQRSIRNELADPRDGLQRQAQLLKDTIRANNVPSTTTTKRVEAIVDELNRLNEQHLEPTEPAISGAKQEAEKTTGTPDQKKVTDDLKKATKQQTLAEQTLDNVLKRLEQWAGAGEIRAEARAIKDLVNKAGAEGKAATEKIESGKPQDQLTPSEKAELNKAAERFQRLADRAGAVMSKAERTAEEKSQQAKTLEAEAAALKAEAGKAGTPAEAEKLNAQAAQKSAEAGKAQAEANALREAVQKAGGQNLQNDLRNAGEELQKNNAASSAEAEKSAGKRLDALSQALGEKQPKPEEELQQKKKNADAIDKLAEEQDELRKKVQKAEKIEDPKQREEELKKLGREQEQLRKKTEDLLEKLTRDRETEAADKLREASEKMEAAKDELNQGQAPKDEQKEALDRLDESVKKLDQERQKDEEKLSSEKREELANQLKALRDKLQATDDEAARIQAEVLKKQGWDRAKIVSLGDLDGRSKTLAEELAKFATKELEPAPVFKQLVEQAAVLTEQAGTRFAERKDDALDSIGQPYDAKAEAVGDDRTRRPLKTAIRRLDHVLNSLKDDPKDKNQQPPKPMEDSVPMPPMPMGEQQQQQGGLPQMAQVKALRAIQAELNERTTAFAKAHPDADKYTEADKEELEELERSQREVAGLFDKIKDLFKKMGQGAENGEQGTEGKP
jgi:D-ribose pyranose/furanose isomerase RbsD